MVNTHLNQFHSRQNLTLTFHIMKVVLQTEIRLWKVEDLLKDQIWVEKIADSQSISSLVLEGDRMMRRLKYGKLSQIKSCKPFLLDGVYDWWTLQFGYKFNLNILGKQIVFE